MTKKFMFLSLGILALAAAYHLGATTTEAQGGGQFVGIFNDTTAASNVP